MTQELNELIQKYIDDFNAKKDLPFVANPSLPIVWFGDMERYLQSERKILTVGMNPSQNEFDGSRFDVTGFLKNQSIDALEKTLNAYFKNRPYFHYFGTFERVLRIIGASYWESDFAPAIHINIHSALATKKSWNELKSAQKQSIERINLFQSFLGVLSPNIIIASVNEQSLKAGFPKLDFETPTVKTDCIKKHRIHPNCVLINGKSGVGGAFFGIRDAVLENELSSLLLS